MLKRLRLISILLLLLPAAALAQSASTTSAMNVQMSLPPPVSSSGLSTHTEEQGMSNYFQGGILFGQEYVQNLYPGFGTRVVNENIFSLQPSIAFDHTSIRTHEKVNYKPTFEYYAPDSSLDTIDQSGSATYRLQVAPHVNFLADDTASKTSDTFEQQFSSGSVSSGLPYAASGLVAPFAPQISNSANAQLTWQLFLNGMVGFGGNSTLLNFTKPSAAEGLFDSNSRSASAFYTYRAGRRQYLGGLYEYSMITATPVDPGSISKSHLGGQNFLAFYTAYLSPKLSVSLGGGTQYYRVIQDYRVTQAPAASFHAWSPIAIGSIGWQAHDASFALAYSHVVTEGGGTIGAYAANDGNLSAQWQLSPRWTAGIRGEYSALKPVARSFIDSTTAGHTVSVGGSLGRELGSNLSISFQYQYLHQTYSGIPSIEAEPNTYQEEASISYHFSKPLGM